MSKIIPYIKCANPLPGYKLRLMFDDGISGEIDLVAWKGKGGFSQWNNEENFRNFIITPDRKILWSEEIDMDPDAFYLQLVGKSFEEYTGNKQFLRDINQNVFR